MKPRRSERGQVLILIVFAMVVLIALTGLAVDGASVYADRRHAQNAADAGALAGALANTNGQQVALAALATANTDGYNNDRRGNTVYVGTALAPSGACPNALAGVDVTVTIVSHVPTMLARVIGTAELTNQVLATARSCPAYRAPFVPGAAIVSLAPSGIGYSAGGIPQWNVTGGGVFANSTDSAAAECFGNAGVTVPSVSTVGGTSFTCHHVSIGTTTTGLKQLQPADYMLLFPPTPACDGTASLVNGTWQPQAGANGSKVAFSGDMAFAPGLYCVTNSPGPYHGQISGAGVTFYIMSPTFSMKFNGAGNLTAACPYTGTYAGVLMFSAPHFSNGVLQQTQQIDMRGNGSADVIGAVIMPSADITMFGNSGTAGFNTEIVGYRVDSGGNADININYQAGMNYQAPHPSTLYLVK